MLEIWESIAIDIMEKNNFSFSSRFEASIAATLDIMGIGFSFKNTQFAINYRDTPLTYTPDFIIDLTVNEKRVLLEPHGKRYIDGKFIEKMHAFMSSTASSDYYIVLITDKMPKKPDKLKIELKNHKYKKEDICDEVWYIPYNPVTGSQLNLKNESGSIYGLLNKLRDGNENCDREKQMLRNGSNRNNSTSKSVLKSTY